MGIRIEQPGASKLAAAAGTATGKAARAKEERARADQKRAEQLRLAQQQLADAARQRAQETAMEWEMQKMQINSQRAFERELRQEDYRLMADDRAAQGAIERMEVAKNMDFQYKEQERMRQQQEIDAKITTLEKAQEDGQFTGKEPEFEAMMFDLEQQKFGIKRQSKLLDPQQRLLYDMQRQVEADASGGTTTGVGPPPPTGDLTVQNMEAIAAVGKTYLRRKADGVLVEVPIGNAKDAVATGRFVFPKVTGPPGIRKQFPDIVRQETARPQRGSFFF